MARHTTANTPGWYDRYQQHKLKILERRDKRKKGGSGPHGIHPKHRGYGYREPRPPKPMGWHKCKCGRRISWSYKRCLGCASGRGRKR